MNKNNKCNKNMFTESGNWDSLVALKEQLQELWNKYSLVPYVTSQNQTVVN